MRRRLVGILLIALPMFSFALQSKENDIFRLASRFKDNSVELRELAEKGIDINQKRPGDGLSALHLAARSGALENLKTLIELGADVNIQDIEGHSPLDYTRNRAPEFSDTLIKAGGQRFRLWGVTIPFAKSSALLSVVFYLVASNSVVSIVFYLGVFTIAAAIFKIAQRRYKSSILAFGVVGISYFLLIILPQIKYSGFSSLPYIRASELVFAIFPIATSGAYIIAGSKSEIITRLSNYTVAIYILLSSYAAFIIIPGLIMGLAGS